MAVKTVTLTDEIISHVETYRQLRVIESGKPISFSCAFREVMETVVTYLNAQFLMADKKPEKDGYAKKDRVDKSRVLKRVEKEVKDQRPYPKK